MTDAPAPHTFAIDATVISYGSERLVRNAVEQALMAEHLSPRIVTVQPLSLNSGGRRLTDKQAMDSLFAALNGKEWGSEQWSDVGLIIEMTGRTLAGPDDVEPTTSHEEN